MRHIHLRCILAALFVLAGFSQSLAQPEWKSSATAVGNWTSTATVAKPSGLAVGDLMVVSLLYSEGGHAFGSNYIVVQPPDASWALLNRDHQGWLEFRIYYKFADASDVAAETFTFTLSRSTYWTVGMSAIEDANTQQPLLPGAFNKGVGFQDPDVPNFTAMAPSVTTLGGDMLVLAFFAAKENTTSPFNGFSAITDATIRLREQSPNGQGYPALMMASYPMEAAGPTGTRSSFMNGQHRWLAQQVMVAGTSVTPAPVALTYPTTDHTFYTGTEITPLVPVLEGVADTYEITPALPAGLGIDASTGVISGTPTQAKADTEYTVSAYNSAGGAAVTATLNIEVILGTLFSSTYDATEDARHTFTVPEGINTITVETWGGGGGTSRTNNPKSGGGGGAYARSTLTVVPGAQYTVNVGKAGTGSGGKGGTSWIRLVSATDSWENYPVLSEGGFGASTGGGAPGGRTSESKGEVRYDGGEGGDGNGAGGGGGGSGMATGKGGNGSDAPAYGIGGSGGIGAGNGGRGGDNNQNGQNGFIPGGGGGGKGGGSGNDSDPNDGRGAPGQVLITWEVPTPPTDLSYENPSSPYTYGDAITNITPSVTGNPAHYSVSPALPAGMSLNPSTGVISGTPRASTPETTYTITASNASGEITATLTFAVNKRNITIPLENISKVYGAAEPTISFEDFPTLAHNDNIDFFPLGKFAREPGEDVGTYTITMGTVKINHFHYVDAQETLTDVTEHYHVTFSPAHFEITKRPVSLAESVTAEDKTYDGGTAAALSGSNLGGVISDDEVSLDDLEAVFAQAAVGEGIAVTVTASLTGAHAGNYEFLAPTGLTADITQRPLTIGGSFSADGKLYDKTTAAVIGSNSLTLENTVDGDDVGLLNVVAEFPGVDVGQALTVSLTSGELGGEDASNYTLSLEGAPTATADIDPKPLTLTGVSASDKTYDGTNIAEIVVEEMEGVEDGDEVSLASSQGTFSQATVGENLEVTANLTLGGAQNGNYRIEQPTGLTADITVRQLTIGGTFEASGKTFDGSADASIATNALTLENVVDDDEVTLIDVVAAFASANASADIAVNLISADLEGDDASNYTLSLEGAPTAMADIDPLGLSLTGSFTVENKDYDGTTSASIASSSVSLSGTLGSNVELAGFVAEFEEPTAGDGKTVRIVSGELSGDGASNYQLHLDSAPTAQADILPLALTVTGVVANSKPYDGTDAATLNIASATLVGVIDPDVVSLATPVGVFAQTDIGNGIPVTPLLTLAGEDAANYTLTQPEGLNANIVSPEAVVISVEIGQHKTYGSADPVLAYSVTAGTLVDGHRWDGQLGREEGESAGLYAITMGTLKILDENDADVTENYTVLFEPAPFTIHPKVLTLSGSFTVAPKPYDGTTQATLAQNQLSLAGVLDGDDVLLASVSATFADPEVGAGKPVAVTAASLGGPDAPNYTLSLDGAPAAVGDIVPNAVSLAKSTVSVTPAMIQAGETATVTVVLVDDFGNPVAADVGTVTLSSSLGSLGPVNNHHDGTYTAAFTSQRSGQALINARLNAQPLQDHAEVLVVPSVASAATSTIAAEPDTVFANTEGSQGLTNTSVLTVRVYDAYGNPFGKGGDEVVIEAGLGTVGAVADQGDGQYKAEFRSSDLGTAQISATLNGEPLNNHAFVTVLCADVPQTVVLTAPAPDSTGAPLQPTWIWEATTHALTYDFHLSTQPDFLGADDVIVGEIQGTSWNAAQPLRPDSRYYWRVRARGTCAIGPWSATSAFDTGRADDPMLPSSPELLSPANLTEGTNPLVVFEWASVPGARHYQLQVATDAGFSSRLTDRDKLEGQMFRLDGLQWNTTYYWRVRAANLNHSSSWSETRQFRVGSRPEFSDKWSSPVDQPMKLASVSGPASGQKISVGADGRAWVAFLDETTGSNARVKLLQDGAWSDVGGSIHGVPVEAMDLSVGPDGSPWLSSIQQVGGSLSTLRHLASGWVAAGNPFSGKAVAAAFHMGDDGTAWSASSTADGQVRLHKLPPTSAAWQSETIRNSGKPVSRLEIALLRDGSPVVAISESGDQGQIHLAKLDNGSWTDVGGFPTGPATLVDMTASASGEIWVLIQEPSNRLQLWRFDGQAWSEQSPTADLSANAASLAASPDEGIWLSHTSLDKSIQMFRWIGGSWTQVGQNLGWADHVDITVGPDTRPWLAYRESSTTTTEVLRLLRSDEIATSLPDDGVLPAAFQLHGNYPNPFNPTTNIRFDLARAGRVTLAVYNAIGQRVALLVDDALPAGTHTLTFDAQGLPSGMYLYQIRMGSLVMSRKMVLIK